MADPAPMKESAYRDPRPAETFDGFHARVRAKEPGPAYEITRTATSLLGLVAFRARAYGTERVPGSGPLLLAPNHFSNLDHFFLGLGVRRRIHFMAKSQLFVPPIDRWYANGGTFPVRRGARDEESFATVAAILRRGGTLATYCEGTRSRTAELGAVAKPGIGRIALESGATVLPVALHGSSHVRNWKRGRLPKVSVLFGTPFRYPAHGEGGASREAHQAAADEILDEIRVLYAVLRDGGRAAARAWRPGDAAPDGTTPAGEPDAPPAAPPAAG